MDPLIITFTLKQTSFIVINRFLFDTDNVELAKGLKTVLSKIKIITKIKNKKTLSPKFFDRSGRETDIFLFGLSYVMTSLKREKSAKFPQPFQA